eukprot:g1315.t1
MSTRLRSAEDPKTTEEPPKRTADSTDPVASFLTRRFGVGAGFAWLGILAVGSLGEQIKTRLEVRQEEENAREVTLEKSVTLKSGVEFTDKKIGGGELPYDGAILAINLKGSVNGEVFVDTFKSGKQIVFLLGRKPLSEGLTEGLVEAIQTMKTGGVRAVVVPPSAAFGSNGTVLFTGKANETQIPPNATIDYLVELKRVSIAP